MDQEGAGHLLRKLLLKLLPGLLRNAYEPSPAFHCAPNAAPVQQSGAQGDSGRLGERNQIGQDYCFNWRKPARGQREVETKVCVQLKRRELARQVQILQHNSRAPRWGRQVDAQRVNEIWVLRAAFLVQGSDVVRMPQIDVQLPARACHGQRNDAGAGQPAQPASVAHRQPGDAYTHSRIIASQCYAQPVRAPAILLLLLLLLSGCPKGGTGVLNHGLFTGDDAGATNIPAPQLAWLDPQVHISTAVRYTTPGGLDVRQAAYWQPQFGGMKPAPLTVAVRTRDYSKRADNQPDPERIAVLDLATGLTEKLDPGMTGLPIQLVVSPNHRYACVAVLEPQGKGYSLQAVDLRGYGFGPRALEVRPQPSVTPWQVLDNGQALCRVVREVSIQRGLPAASIDWSGGLQLCTITAGTFAAQPDSTVPSPQGRAGVGYVVTYDPALPDKAHVAYLLRDGRRLWRWDMSYYAGEAPFDWQPPVRWLDAETAATVTYRPGALGADASGLFRIVGLTRSGDAHLIEDRATPDLTLASAPGVLLYALQSGENSWSVWAASPDGLQKQRVWSVDDTMYLEVLDIEGGRRVLVHRQYFGKENPAQLHSELRELSLDPLTPTKGKVDKEDVAPLPKPKGVVEQERAVPKPKEPAPEDNFPSGPGDNGGFVPDNPGDGPPPISNP